MTIMRAMAVRLLFLSIGALALAFVAACNAKVEPVGEMETPEEAEDTAMGNLFGDDAFRIGGTPRREDGAGAGGGIGVNSFLWRASLDTLSFLPLASADPFGGVIITDWYTPPETPGERFKVTVYILDRQLRSDGVKASVFRQVRDEAQVWADAETQRETGARLEETILTRARQMRISQAGN